MSIINIPNKSPGDTFFSEEANEIVNAIKKIQESTGWGVYSDTQFDQAQPFLVTQGSPFTQVPNNAGVKTETYLPIVAGQPFPLYDGNKIIAPSVGAQITGFIHFIAEMDQNDTFFDIGFDIGGAFNEVHIDTRTLPKGSNTPHEYTIPFSFGVDDTVFTNSIIVKVRPEGNADLTIWNIRFYVSVDSQPA